MYTQPWSEDEVAILKSHYPEHGRYWSMWEVLLPDRTDAAIERKARLMGLTTIAVMVKRRPAKRTRPIVEPHRSYGTEVAYDPSEKHVMECMRRGMTPSEIDKKNGWWPGKTIRILQHRWEKAT